jgi:sterol desaturase/sphingolipid hydroxylase (fatty acid hydroxylase superfamily)
VPDTRLRRFAKSLASAFVVLVSFTIGLVATPIAMLWAFAPGADCRSPCDAPAYAALGLSFFVAPIVGIGFACLGGWAFHRWQDPGQREPDG